MPTPLPSAAARDLRIRIQPSGSSIDIHAETAQPLSKADASFNISFLQYKPYRELIRKLSAGEALSDSELRDIAERQFAAIFRESVRDLLRDQQARLGPGERLRILLEIEAAALHALPWELLLDPWRGALLGENDPTTVLRLFPLAQPAPPLPAPRGLHIHAILSRPSDYPPLDTQAEEAIIRNALTAEIGAGRVRLTVSNGKLSEIEAAIASRPHILHFVGHGGFDTHDAPAIFLEGENGTGIAANSALLKARLFSKTAVTSAENAFRLIVLNACQTSSAPSTQGYSSLAFELLPEARAVVAMQYPVSDGSARSFAGAFYRNLVRPLPLDESVSAARQAIRDGDPANQRDWLAPVLISTEGEFVLQREWKPFKGPRPYGREDSLWFQGRKKETTNLQTSIARQPVTILWGKSNAGKTSLLMAGYLPEASPRLPVAAAVESDIETRLRAEINAALAANKRPPLAEGPLAAQLPEDLVIVLDRAEQLENPAHPGRALVGALADWAVASFNHDGAARLVLIVRRDEDSPPVDAFWQNLLPTAANAMQELEPLDRDRIAEVIHALTQNTPVQFHPKAITDILEGLQYEHEKSMLKAQVVCQRLYEYARKNGQALITEELLNSPALGGVAGILANDYELDEKLKTCLREFGDVTKRIMTEFLRRDKTHARPVLEEILLLRANAPPENARALLDRLVEEGILYVETTVSAAPGEDNASATFYELAHEGLVNKIAPWFDERASSLRRLDEIIEQTGAGILPIRSEIGGLEELRQAARAGELPITRAQQTLVLRSALEAGYANDSEAQQCCRDLFTAIPNHEVQLAALTQPHLSSLARRRAALHLGQLAAQPGEIAQKARAALANLALDDAPDTCQAASLQLAPYADPQFLQQAFSPAHAQAVTALAHIFRASGVEPKDGRLSKIRSRLFHLNAANLYTNALRGGVWVAIGFVFTAIFAWFQNALKFNAPREAWLALLPVALMAFILSLPGGLALVTLRNAAQLWGGGNRARFTAAGALIGGATGMALAITPLSALAQSIRVDQPFDWLPTLGGMAFGMFAAAGWLSELGLPLLPAPARRVAGRLVPIAAALVGALGLYWLYAGGVTEWWPKSFLLLSPSVDNDAFVIGALLAFFTALGYKAGRLR